jgi:hypothetical protein
MLECYSRTIAFYCNCTASTIPIIKKGKYQENLTDCFSPRNPKTKSNTKDLQGQEQIKLSKWKNFRF